MKLQKLIIHNIASIEDATIDFDAQPLASSEVFLITGKTGSGKSTILDAICLALFADTPRLDATKMQGDTKDGDVDITIKDPRQLMRRGTGEASVSLTFTGSNGIPYEAKWSVARARNKVTGNIQKKSWQLTKLDSGFTYAKDKEVSAEIQAAIGLDFSQFCRTTMLAQGEFTRFLNSKDDEKAAILEKITGVDVYSKIGKKVFEVTGQKKVAWEQALQKTEGMRTLSEEDIAVKKETVAGYETLLEQTKKADEEDKAKLQWIKTDADLEKAVGMANQEHQKAQEVVESDDFKKKETFIDQWNATIEARGWLDAINGAEKSISEGKKRIEECECAIARENMTLTETLQPALEKAQKVENDAQRALEQQSEAMRAQETTLAELGLPTLRKQRDEAKDLQRNIVTTYERIEAYKKEKERRENKTTSLKETLVEIEKKQKDSAAMDPFIHDAKVKMDDRKALLDKQSDTINKFAKTLRQKLRVGDCCPVCRQEIKSELPHEEELAKLVGDLKTAYTEAETTHQEWVNKKNKIDAEIKAAKASYDKEKDTFDKDNSLKMATQKVVASCKTCGFETIDKDTTEKLATLKTNNETLLQDLENKIAEGEKKENLIKAQRDALDKANKGLEQLKKATQKTQQDINDCKSRIAITEEVKKNTRQVQLRQAEETVKANSEPLKAFLDTHPDLSMESLANLSNHSSQAI